MLSRVEPGQYLDRRPPGKTIGCCWKRCYGGQQGVLTLWYVWVLMPQYSDGDRTLQQVPSFEWDVKPRSWLSVVIKNPRMSFEKSRGVTSASWPNLPTGLWPSWPPNNPHLYWLSSSLCLLSTSKLVCGGRSGALWLLLHHPGGCCTLVVVEEIPSYNVKWSECLEKRYINVMNYYYYYDSFIVISHSYYCLMLLIYSCICIIHSFS